MINPAKLEEIAKQITDNMPQGVKNLADTIEGKTKQAIQNKLAEMDFVSRDEFDIQSQVLIRTREKLTELEEKVALLEQQLASKQDEQYNKVSYLAHLFSIQLSLNFSLQYVRKHVLPQYRMSLWLLLHRSPRIQGHLNDHLLNHTPNHES